MSFFQTPAFLWGMAIVIGVAVAIIILTEAIDRLKRIDHPLASVLQLVRNVLLLLLAVFFVQRMVVGLTYPDLSIRLVATAMWLVVIVVILRLINIVYREGEGPTWHDGVPPLLKRLPIYLAIAFIVYYVLQIVWSLPLSEYAAAIGLGSVAVAFALQDTISNLVSGLFILVNRPFAEGEWIHIGDVEGRVVAVNWRYTRIETRNGDLIAMPNGSIAQQSITNHSQPFPYTRVVESLVTAYVNPPNKVKRMLMDTMRETPGILDEPAPVVAVTTIDDPLMGYEFRYWIDDYAAKPAIHNDLMTRIWYAARRYGVALPSPAYDLYHYDGPTVNQEAEVTPAKIFAMLRSVDTFAMLPDHAVQEMADAGTFLEFARGERMVAVGDVEQGVTVLITGSAEVTVTDSDGHEHHIETVVPGRAIGETGLFQRAVSPYTTTANEDVEAVRIGYAAMTNVVNQYPELSAGVSDYINQRRLAIERTTETPGRNDAGEVGLQTNGRTPAIQGDRT